MANVARYLYKSESIMVYISGMKIGGNLIIKNGCHEKMEKVFIGKNVHLFFKTSI